MKDTTRSNATAIVVTPENFRRLKKRTNERCSICNHRTWFDAVPVMEPEGVPEPRLSWILCHTCYQSLLVEMRRSPIRTHLRLRISIGLVASERWHKAYPTTLRTVISDRRWIIVMAWGFAIAMILHLALIVMIAYIAK
ncbi:MAG TPA: hypothetical protein VKU38_04240 [Ktedonobacteraceae bacterium]|nr:hypothetical protein [Ktedonobacteraceae bacterium]